MATVTSRCFEATGRPCVICDFSPPRSGDPSAIDVLALRGMDADFISVAYNPGRAVRVNSALLAAFIKQQTAKDVVFTLATRDMNKLAVQSLLLGAQLLGLENVVVAKGDPFTQRDLEQVKEAGDFTPTGMIATIDQMNQGLDFRERRLAAPTDFCVGATIDLGRPLLEEARLTQRKFMAGTRFFITQPVFGISEVQRFRDAYQSVAKEDLTAPVFYGLQILEQDGVLFSSVPDEVRRQLEQGRSGVDLALELYHAFRREGINNIYLVPPIRRGGARNYGAASEFLAVAKGI